MKGLVYFLATSAGGALGWWAGAFVGIGTALVLSALGSCLGVVAAWKLMREFLD